MQTKRSMRDVLDDVFIVVIVVLSSWSLTRSLGPPDLARGRTAARACRANGSRIQIIINFLRAQRGDARALVEPNRQTDVSYIHNTNRKQ